MHTLLKKSFLPLITRRLIAIDLGSSNIKLLLAEEVFGRVRIIHHQIIDLQEEGLLSANEINRHLQKRITELGNHPIALAIPQHLAISHLVDLPKAGEREIKSLIERETINLIGLSESSIIYDYQRLKPYGRHQNPFWVTISREQEIQRQIDRLIVDEDNRSICDITTVTNAQIAALLSKRPPTERLVLVDLGATSTAVAIVDNGQAIYASSFPIGSESFTGAIASLKKCSFEEAESIKRSSNLFAGPNAIPEFTAVVDIWQQDLKKLLSDWEQDNPEIATPGNPFKVLLSGGGALQPGLLFYLQQKSVFEIEVWPDEPAGEIGLPLGRFAVAYGLSMQVFNKSLKPTSLLPKPLRMIKKRQQQLMGLNWIGLCLLLVMMASLALGSAQKLILVSQKSAAVDDAEAALRKAQSIEALIQRRERDYASVWPLLEHQEQTIGALKTLQILQELREKRDLWFLLLADQPSYFQSAPYDGVSTNAASIAAGSLPAKHFEPPDGFIVELCIPENAGDSQKLLREVVDELKKQAIFSKVDALPANQRQTNILDPSLVVPNQFFSLSIEMAKGEFPPPMLRPLKKTNSTTAPKPK